MDIERVQKNEIHIGSIFNRLTVIDGPIRISAKNGIRRRHWMCECICGNMRLVDHYNLLRGTTSSCGCYRLDRVREVLFKHGQSGREASSEWITWIGIKDRCLNPNNNAFFYYGGRGISVCQRWMDSFENFYADIGPKPTPRHSIDRIDVNGNYEPGNCKWATAIEQASNKSNNVNLTYDGETHCVAEWARRVGLGEHLIRKRIKMGWDHERALTTPRGASGKRRYMAD